MAYSGAFGRRECFGDEPLDPCSNSSGQDRFEPTSCSRAGGLISLILEGAVAEPPLSIGTSGMTAGQLNRIGSWGVAAEPPPHPPILHWHPE